MKKKTMLGAINGMLSDTLGPELGQKIFEANFYKRSIDSYMPGKVLTFGELKALPDRAIVYVHYVDEDGNDRMDDFGELSKDDDDEWSVDAHPFPMDEHENDDVEILRRDNSGWQFTIREAVPAKKGEYKEVKKNRQKITGILEKLQEVHSKYQSCTDKQKKKELKNKSKDLEKQLKKLGFL